MALMSYGLTRERAENTFLQAHSSLLPNPSTPKVKGNSKAYVGGPLLSSRSQFFLNYCDLENSTLSRAQV